MKGHNPWKSRISGMSSRIARWAMKAHMRWSEGRPISDFPYPGAMALKASTELCPPKPKELLSAARTGALRALLAV